MKKLKLTAGILWAFIALIVIVAMFPSWNNLSASVSKFPFMKINPRYTGGEVAYKIAEDGCTLDIRKPVFNGIFRERNSGFVQIDWRGSVPEIIKDTIDYDNDETKDFIISINRNTKKMEMQSLNNAVTSVYVSTPTSYGWAIRVGLRK